MKRLISILLTVCMCFSIGMVLTACGDNESHEHTYKTEWAYDDTYHWHACEGEDCADVSDKAEHSWNDGEITTEASADADGIKTFTCTVCGKTKTEVVEYVVQDVDKSGYAVFYYDTSDDGFCTVHYNKEGLPVEVYEAGAFYGELDEENLFLPYSIVYTDDNLISSITTPSRYYEITYDASGTSAYGVAYRSDTLKKAEDGKSLVLTYNDNKQLVTINIYDTTGSLTQFCMNDQGRVERLIEGKYVNLYEYDEANRLISCTILNLSNEDDVTEIVELSYSGDSTLPTSYTHSENGDVDYAGSDITYDENAQILTSTMTCYEDGVVDYICSQISQFDGDGKLVACQIKYGDEKEYESSDWLYREWVYDGNGMLIEEIDFIKDGDNKLLTYKEQYEYDANGNCIKTTYSYFEEDGITVGSTRSTSYTYDTNDLRTSMTMTYSDGFGYRYTYDANGFLIRSEYWIHEDGEEGESTEYQWIFDDEGRLLKGLQNNGMRSELTLTYDDLGRKSSATLGYNTYDFTYDEYDRIVEIGLTHQYERWSDALNDYEQKTGTGTNTYTYSENGELTSAVFCEWDYENDCYVAITCDYTTIE